MEVYIESMTNGAAQGCTDTDKPEDFTNEQLTALKLAMYFAEKAGLDKDKVWALAPYKMRMEYIYAKWNISAPQRKITAEESWGNDVDRMSGAFTDQEIINSLQERW